MQLKDFISPWWWCTLAQCTVCVHSQECTNFGVENSLSTTASNLWLNANFLSSFKIPTGSFASSLQQFGKLQDFYFSKTVFFSFSSGKTSGNLIYFRVITRNSNNENEPKGNVIGHKLKNKRVCSEDFSLALHHLECHSIRCCYDRARDLCPKFFFYRFQVLPINRTKTWECSGATLKWGVK